VRGEPNDQLTRSRVHRLGGPAGTNTGQFIIRIGSSNLQIVASDGGGWDHVSVSLRTRCPTWDEMCAIKSIFFLDEETVIQFHPAKSEYVNVHKFCLHMWRPQSLEEVWEVARQWADQGEEYPYPIQSPGEIPIPPSLFVGPKETP